jgi:hypothetical protein
MPTIINSKTQVSTHLSNTIKNLTHFIIH